MTEKDYWWWLGYVWAHAYPHMTPMEREESHKTFIEWRTPEVTAEQEQKFLEGVKAGRKG